MGRKTINTNCELTDSIDKSVVDWNEYYAGVKKDFLEMKDSYPFSFLSIFPTLKPEPAVIQVTAAHIDLIKETGAKEADFLGDYSRRLFILIPVDYRKSGCIVYGAKWLDLEKICDRDRHFHSKKGRFIQNSYGFQLCVGTPESFVLLKNVILEVVRTAENMLIAYEEIMTGKSDKLSIIAYPHGDKGRDRYKKNTSKYMTLR